VWNLQNGQQLGVLREEFGRVCAVQFLPDNIHAIAGLYTGDVVIWNVRTAQVVTGRKAHNSRINSIAVSGDGQIALTASDDKLIVWKIGQ
jgi:WD40 repeat protein